MLHNFETIAEGKAKAILNVIPEHWRLNIPIPAAEEQRDITGEYIQQFLTASEVEITETDAVGILEHTTTGKWSARDVTEAFCHRAAIAHQLTNCLLDIFIDVALEHADTLDAYYHEHNRPIGPLHGLPISLKDQFHVRGAETTMGYVGWIGTFEGQKGTGKERHFESQLVTDLRQLGAVFYCKTSVPPSLMSPETHNNIVGYLFNPKNRHLSAGGSSGGEGALISLRGSPVGMGTDIGGSIRIPSSFNGVYGLRSSTGRLPYERTPNSMDGQESILSVVGPMATTLRSLTFVMKALLSMQPWLHDPMVIELPWRDEQASRLQTMIEKLGSSGKLSFGVLRRDDVVLPSPPVRRAIEIVVKALENAGHEVIEWKPPPHSRGLNIAIEAWMYEGGEDIHNAFGLSGEPVISHISRRYGNKPVEQKRASDIAANNIARRKYRKEYLDYWNSTSNLTHSGQPVDAFISPVSPYGGTRPNTYHYVTYSTIINVLDYSSVAFPVTYVDKNVDVVDDGYVAANPADQQVFESYDPEIHDGSPVGLQVVGRRLQEEKTLALAKVITDLLA
ncbi:Amidase [Trichoderma simmonsii]|uniref:amidase n=1 Tax=Trichoderma simmonsii TaxID=1491479 RepID=A0A8G0L953_9HYPO|nr:Amidase [Trichoderma simmonsii]